MAQPVAAAVIAHAVARQDARGSHEGMNDSDVSREQATRINRWWLSLHGNERDEAKRLGPDDQMSADMAASLKAYLVHVVELGTPTLENGVELIQSQNLKDFLAKQRREG
ncbi:hypothetical protein OG453_33585 [Streptomyces sp. NBC_01381]|uniref:hypothetical protein n=1 Tax=Streptomyces sp. NBC_01381 TaxID=2903845 RepID=UPI0022587052|nr:hypothetical protein [Streptomyces sp. NBC_01381]MCX4671565.1 hypothetical protein [Streptomyces sp. NBC_01381]